MGSFFAEVIENSQALLSPEDSHHALRVLRLKPGQDIQVCVEGRRYQATLDVQGNTAMARILQEIGSTEAHTRITLYQGWPKGDKMDLIVRQATELGVHAIVPCLFARCVARPESSEKRLLRLKKIAREAAMQSGRTLVPRVHDVISFKEACKLLQQHEMALLPYELARDATLPAVFRGEGDVAMVIGPEGGFTEAEVAALPAQAVTLGKRILRTETAGVAAMAMLLALAHDF